MAEAFNDLTLPDDKAARYATVAQEIAAVLDGEPNRTARMATIASMLAASFEHLLLDRLLRRRFRQGP
jgi:L-methionine (R)-S-oxide reductase